MATTVTHIQMGVVDSRGNVNIVYPLNTAKDVQILDKTNTTIPANINTVQALINNFGDMAFKNSDNVVFLGENEDADVNMMTTEIDDSQVSRSTTWSSKKMQDLFDDLYSKLRKAGISV